MALLDSFKRATPQAKFLNATCLLSTFLALIGCFVGFAGHMFTVTTPAGDAIARWEFYALYVQTDANRMDYGGLLCEQDIYDFCDPCKHGGRAFLAMTVLSFPLLIALAIISTFRVAGGVSIRALAHPARSLQIESWGCFAATVCYFCAVVSFGGTCYKAAQDYDTFTTHVSGFAYLMFCFFGLLVQLGVLTYVKRVPGAHLGWQPTSSEAAQRFVDGADEEAAREAAEEEQIRQARRQSRAMSHSSSFAEQQQSARVAAANSVHFATGSESGGYQSVA